MIKELQRSLEIDICKDLMAVLKKSNRTIKCDYHPHHAFLASTGLKSTIVWCYCLFDSIEIMVGTGVHRDYESINIDYSDPNLLAISADFILGNLK